MSRASVLPLAKDFRYLTIREDFIELCSGNHCKAAILGVLERWTNWSIDREYQNTVENAAARKEGKEELFDTDMFFYLSVEQFKTELLGLYGEDKISKSLTEMIDLGWVSWRNNPKYKWDRTKQYRLQVSKLTELLAKVTPPSTRKTPPSIAEKQGMDESKTGNGFRENREAIPQDNIQNNKQDPTPTLESERLGNSQPDLEPASTLDSDTSDLVVPFAEEKTVESESVATAPTTDLGKKRGGAATRAANAETAGSAARAKLEQIEGFSALWEKYEKVRSEKRQKLTPTARGEALEMLLEHPKPLEVIRYTVANGYTGLVFDKFRDTKTTPNSVVEPEPQAPVAKGIPEGEDSPGTYRTPNGQTIKVFNSYAGFVWLDESGDRSIPERETVGWRKVGGLT